MYRVGRGAAMVQRQGRLKRYLLLRNEPMVRCFYATAPPHRHMRLGGRGRLL